MEEAERLANNGTKELLVIAQDSTSYGWDLERKVYLSDLLKELNTIGGYRLDKNSLCASCTPISKNH